MDSAKNSMARWWVLVCAQLLLLGIAVYFGVHELLWTQDKTKLSFVSLIVWAGTTVAIGFWHLQSLRPQRIDHLTNVGWFASETCLALGLIGTVAGFILMLGTTFDTIDVNDVSSVQEALTNMALGMSTALYTTLVGLITSLFLKIQLVNMDHMLDQDA